MKKYFIFTFIFFTILCRSQSDESSNLNYGMKLYNDRVYDVAVTQFRYFLERYPSSVSAPKVLSHLAEAYIGLGDVVSGMKSYQRLILEYPNSEFTEQAIFKTAEILSGMNEKVKAARYYLQLKNYFPGSARVPESYYKAVKLFYETGITEEAVENALMLKKNYPSSVFSGRAQLILASIYEKEKQTALAEKTYSSVFSSSSDELRSEAGTEYSVFLVRNNDTASARKILRETYSSVSKKDANYYTVLAGYAEILLMSGEPDEALKIISEDKNIPEENRKKMKVIRADALYYKGDMNSAADGYREALDISEDLTTVLKRSYALAGANDYSAAAAETDRYLMNINIEDQDETQVRSAFISAGENYIKAGMHDDALAVLRKYASLFPADPDAPKVGFMTARAYYDSENYAQAYEYLKKHQELYPASEFADDAVFLSAESAFRNGLWRTALDRYVFLLKNYGASEFAGIASSRIEFLNDHKVREDNLNDKLAALSSGAVFEPDKARLAAEWAKFYFYDLKDYVKAGDFTLKFYELAGGGNAGHEIKFIEAVSALRIEKATDEKVSAAYAILESILKDKTAQKQIRSKSAHEMLKVCDRVFGTSELQAVLDEIMSAVRYDNLDNEDNALAYLYILKKNKISDPALVLSDIDRLYINKKDASTFNDTMLLKAELLRKTDGNERSKELYSALASSDYKTRSKFISLTALTDDPSAAPEEKLKYLSVIEKDFPYAWTENTVKERRAQIYLASGEKDKALNEYLSLQKEAEKGNVFGTVPAGRRDYSAEIAQIYFDKSEFSRAESYYLKALSGSGAEKDRQAVLGMLSEVYKATGNKEALEANLKSVSAASEGEKGYEAALALSDLEFEKDNVTKAISMYQGILKKYRPEDKKPVESKIIVAHFTKKSITEGDKLLADFRRKYKDSYDKDIYEPEFYLAKANGFLAMKEYDKALKSYRALLKDYPNSIRVPKAMYGEAIVLYNIGKKDEAFVIWENIARTYPDDDIAVETNYHLGAVYNNREEFDRAITSFQSIVKYKKDHPLKKNSYKNLIDLYLKLGFNDAGARVIREYISLYPDEEDVFQKRIEIGNIYQRNGEFDTALDYFKRLIYEAKGDDEAACQFFIAETYMMMKNFRQAITEFMKVRYMIKTSSPFEWGLTAMYNTALCYEELTEYDKALDILNEIVKNHPSDSYGRQAKKIVERVEGKKNIER
ncbi:MAG TPA: tetratricopeptide repeat protein [Clostridiales bacterium]|nr:tetratricopeptide repeat protein [Clostridiales bacterium]